MRLESLIGLRFLRSKRRDRSISLITWVSMAGVSLGVAALIVVISVMNGFRHNVMQAMGATEPHLRVESKRGPMAPAEWQPLAQRIAQDSGVEAVAPYLARQAYLSAGSRYRAVVLRGVVPAQEGKVTGLAAFLREDLFGGFQEGQEAEGERLLARLEPVVKPMAPPGIIIGYPLASALGVGVGDEVRVISGQSRATPLGPVPYMKTARVAAIFETGVGPGDELLALAHLELVQRLYRAGQPDGGLAADGLEVRLDDPLEADLEAWQRDYPLYRISSWGSANRNLFQVMKLEKTGLFLILSLIIVVAFFNIIGSLVMLAEEKRQAVAILMAQGATRQLIRRIFLMQGFWIATLGTLSGVALGLFICWVLATFNVVPLPPNVFPASTQLPVRVNWLDVSLIVGASYAICLAIMARPARKAASGQVVAHLRG